MTIVYRGPTASDLAAKEEVVSLRSSKRERKVEHHAPKFVARSSGVVYQSGPRDFINRPFDNL